MRVVLARLARAMSSLTPSEQELRAMTRDELLTYALRVSSAKEAPGTKRQRCEPQEPKKKRQRAFDMARYGQRMVALRLVYLGWGLHGFAAQPTSENTVEHHLFAALVKTRLIASRESCEYSRAGRTDVGVSAMGQVVGLRVRSNVVPPSTAAAELDYVKIINGNLPPQIRVLAWTPVCDGSAPTPRIWPGDSPEFATHFTPAAVLSRPAVTAGGGAELSVRRSANEPFSARFDAVYRSYKYFFVKGAMDIAAMRRGAAHFIGEHDFRNFCKVDVDKNITNFKRVMYNVEIRRASDDAVSHDAEQDGEHDFAMYYIFVKGQAFLWHQVRCMAAVLFDVGLGREDSSLVERMLGDVEVGTGAFASGKPHYRMASPLPLLLYECAYPKSVLSFPTSVVGAPHQRKQRSTEPIHRVPFERADADIAKCYAESALQAAIARSVLQDNDATHVFALGTASNNTSECISDAYGDVRAPRDFLLNGPGDRHIPFQQRACDEAVEVKIQRAALKAASSGREGKQSQGPPAASAP